MGRRLHGIHGALATTTTSDDHTRWCWARAASWARADLAQDRCQPVGAPELESHLVQKRHLASKLGLGLVLEQVLVLVLVLALELVLELT